MHRGVGAAIVAALALLVVAVPAQASPGAHFGIQDDGWLLYGPGSLDQRLATLQGLGVSLVRVTLRWDAVAASRPTQPRDPEAYAWGVYGEALDALHDRGLTALVTLYGSPRWANGGAGPARLPRSGFGDFARAAAARFPWVRLWTVWNEPNNGAFASPVSPSLYVRRLLNPAYASLHRASPRNRVAGGVTSPRKTPSGMAPLAFMQGMRSARARLDAYAVNPYRLSRLETPTHTTCSYCGYFTMAALPRIHAEVTRSFGARTQLWLTEYGYQTNPPDRFLGVSPSKQALYLGESALRVWRQPGVTMLIHFLVRDEPNVGGWQSGLFTVSGKPKPAVHAFALPLAQSSRRGTRTTFWGMVRPGSGARSYVLQRRTANGWRTLAAGRTARSGAFARAVTAPAGTRVRLWSPALGYAGVTLTVS